MSGIVALIVKMMPSSPSVDLKEIETHSKHAMEKQGAQNISFEIRPIAFGLKAVLIKMAWPEDKDTDLAVSELQKVKDVSSVDVEDYRRAFG